MVLVNARECTLASMPGELCHDHVVTVTNAILVPSLSLSLSLSCSLPSILFVSSFVADIFIYRDRDPSIVLCAFPSSYLVVGIRASCVFSPLSIAVCLLVLFLFFIRTPFCGFLFVSGMYAFFDSNN